VDEKRLLEPGKYLRDQLELTHELAKKINAAAYGGYSIGSCLRSGITTPSIIPKPDFEQVLIQKTDATDFMVKRHSQQIWWQAYMTSTIGWE